MGGQSLGPPAIPLTLPKEVSQGSMALRVCSLGQDGSPSIILYSRASSWPHKSYTYSTHTLFLLLRPAHRS